MPPAAASWTCGRTAADPTAGRRRRSFQRCVIARPVVSSARCDSRQAFGFAVVPDVYMISAICSGSSFSGGSFAATSRNTRSPGHGPPASSWNWNTPRSSGAASSCSGSPCAPCPQRRIQIRQHRGEIGELPLQRRREQQRHVRIGDDVAQFIALVARVEMHRSRADQRAAVEQQQVFQAVRHQDADMIARADAVTRERARVATRCVEHLRMRQAVGADDDCFPLAVRACRSGQ